MENELLTINIVIADRTYRIKAARKDEEAIRKTVKFINDKVVEFKTNFAGKDMQDYLSMVVIWYATSLVDNSNTMPESDLKEISGLLAKMENSVNEALQ